MYHQTPHTQSGQSLPEVLVALAVGVVVIGALVLGISTSLKGARFAQDQIQATKLAQDALEKIRATRDKDAVVRLTSGDKAFSEFIDDVNDCNSGCFFKLINENSTAMTLQEVSSGTSVDALGNFNRQIAVRNDNPNQKTFVVRIMWDDADGPHESHLETILTR